MLMHTWLATGSKHISKAMTSTLCLTTLLPLTGCKTSPRTSVTPDDPVSLSVTLYQVSEADIDTYKLNVQMALCAESTGVKAQGTTYTFKVPSLAKDTTCQIHLIGAKASDANVKFFTNSDGLYYKDDQVTIKQDTTGGLKGDAYVQALFSQNIVTQPGSTTYQITAPITAKTALVDTCTCTLDCAPEIANHNALLAKGTTVNDGTCKFVNATVAGTTSVVCNKINLQCGEVFYAAVYNPAVTADAGANKTSTLPTIELQPGVPTTTGDVTIDVQIKNGP